MRNASLRASKIIASTLALLLAIACRVDTHKDGNSDDVRIATPFGGMSVKTNDAVVQEGVGLSVYPGATPLKKDKDNGAADVDMNFGSFHLGVKALSYKTADAPDKVITFYRKDMARYGTVILCRDNQAVGTPVQTQDGLSCDQEKKSHVQISEQDSNGQLKTGSKQHQHIVAIDADGSGTKIGLVALDLPGNITFDDGDERRDKQ